MTLPDMNTFNESVIEQYRAAGGVLDGMLAGIPLLLLTTTGRRSGHQHTIPLGFVEDVTTLVLFASNQGAAQHPAWYLNLVADPEVVVEKGTERFTARARITTGAERERLHALYTSAMPGTDQHQGMTTREIPLVVLER